MADVRDVLEGIRRQVRPQAGSLDRIHATHTRRQRNRKISAAVVAVIVALIGVAAVAQFLDLNRNQVPAPPGMMRLGTIPVTFPQDLAVASGSIWTVSIFRPNTLNRIDPQTSDVTKFPMPPGSNPHDLVAAADSIWVAAMRGGLFRVDPTTGRITAHIPGGYWSVVAGFDSVWVSGKGGTMRVNPTTNEATEVFPRGCILSVAGDSVWASCGDSTRRINPTTLEVIGKIPMPGKVFDAGGNLWLSTGPDVYVVKHPKNASTDLYRLDPSTNQIVPGTQVTIAHGASSPFPLVDGDDIWFPCSIGVGPNVAMLYRFDARAGRIVASFDLGHEHGIGVNSIAFAYGYAWTASGPAGRVRRWTLPTLAAS